ncbi:vitamin K epoxide reductase family protein [Winogradskyella tangerina]|uniref:vitamin K epoxide reductase family protein n=1 Tax=Winogradskyella tangerina TaxID=2023240 RepID=UPI000DBE65E7|nr:vitamin K epoxide reductase family protein [Winogradskyella tangerina]
MKDPFCYLVELLLKKNDLLIDFEELTFQIKSHPSFPSLHAITGVLDHFNIENLALDIPINASTLKQLPETFLAQVEIDGKKKFATVTKSKQQYKLHFGIKDKTTVDENYFLECFTGVVLIVDKTEDFSIINKTNTVKNIVKGLSVVALLTVTAILIFGNLAVSDYLFVTTSILGIYLSSIIIRQEQGESTKIGNAFCSGDDERKDCNAVLNSNAATLVEGLKLSDLSLIFFAGLTLASLILVSSNSEIYSVKLLSVLGFPVTIFSIYYQFIKIKKWCFLCLGIVGILWTQAALFAYSSNAEFNVNHILIALFSFSITALTWLVFSKIYREKEELNQIKIKYFKFKRNFGLFNDQLLKSPTLPTQIPGINEIVYGNPTSQFHLILITNPLCGYCKTTHQILNQALKQFNNELKITIRFNIQSVDYNNSAVKIALRLLEIYHTYSPEACREALDDIYGNHTIKDWFNKWNEADSPENYKHILQNEAQWCQQNNINFTPEILVNGHSYPKMYERKDLMHFMEELLEDHKNQHWQIPLAKV